MALVIPDFCLWFSATSGALITTTEIWIFQVGSSLSKWCSHCSKRANNYLSYRNSLCDTSSRPRLEKFQLWPRPSKQTR
ncbi:hypothetical protein V8C42DRAFT_269222 [Trichoderma barbatum]